jgi:DNA modification methylase
MDINHIYQGTAIAILKTFADASIDCCVTSPPYWGLRDYGTALWIGGNNTCDHKGKPFRTKENINRNTGTGVDKKNKTSFQPFSHVCDKCGAIRIDDQLGLERTPEEFVDKMVLIFEEIRRILKPTGTLWLNLGDSYAHSLRQSGVKYSGVLSQKNKGQIKEGFKPIAAGYKEKDLIGIPWMIAFALRSAGWYLRQDIIWNKPNPMPESVTDRCTKAHEYIFLLSKSQKYYYDAKSIATPYKDKTYTTFGCESKGNGDGSGLVKSENWANDMPVRKPKQWKTPDGWDTGKGSYASFHKEGREKGFKGYEHRGTGDKKLTGHSGNFDSNGDLIGDGLANKKSVWTVGTKAFKEAHFATYPEELIEDCIKAGCPKNGIVLDPFMAGGTTAVVARKLMRNFVGIELNPEYIKIAEKRLYDQIGLFLNHDNSEISKHIKL